MRRFSLWKGLFFIFIALPVLLCLFLIFFLPLILILLLVMPFMAKRFAFRVKQNPREWFYRGSERKEESAYSYDPKGEEGEIVDVEGVVVESSSPENEKEEEKASSNRLLPPH